MRFFQHIGFKLILVVGLVAILIISIFAYFNIQSLRTNLQAEVERHANQLSETVKYSTRLDMLENQRDRIHQAINEIGRQQSIGKIRVLNKTGQIIYSSVENDIGTFVDKNAESCYACHSADRPLERLAITERTRVFQVHPDSSRMLGIINPIYNEQACWSAPCHVHPQQQTVLGVLDVTLPLNEVDKTIRSSRLEMLWFALSSVLALSIIIGLFVQRWVATPVAGLLKATQQVADGNMNHRIHSERKDQLGKLARSFDNMTDKLSEARLQLFQSDKLASLGRLAAGVAHEINNPLTGVLTYSSFLLKRTAHQPEMQEDLKVIVRETLRSREIVKSLLDFARQSVPKKSEADLHEIIERSIAVVQNQLTLRQVELVKNFDAGLPRMTLDANQIQQVFINLIVNGIDAMGNKPGRITIGSSQLRLSLVGMAQVKKAACPKRHSLIDQNMRIEGLASVRVKMRVASEEGFLYIDPLYGRRRDQTSFPVAAGVLRQLSCTECAASLHEPDVVCPLCGAPAFAVEVPTQGKREACTRQGCDWQRWEAMDTGGLREYAEVTVSDTGCGIPAEDLPRIFEPFFSTKGQKGTGLGLSVIWGIIDNHNGTIKVESEVQRGTTFRIRLPIQQPR
ncbi:MAG: HAMP domain-containing protein [Bacteroidetes bacterium]|nr:HAMP domain-containing protein [Bacteroidota bacterium]